MFGYRTYDIKDESKNQPILRLLFLGAGLHNNHHYKSNSHTFNLRNKWYEFDFDGWLIELLFMKKPT
jgi:stearoyl-CoA desaturase (delta-9 desaturase)